eukprot:COSAG06_NODE_2756_length_6336_cov_29.970980_4_plen_354_part_00
MRGSSTQSVLHAAAARAIAATLCTGGNAETLLFQQLVGGDVLRADRLLALTLSANAVIEFCFGPTLGRVMDAIGRRKIFLGYPLYGVFAWTAVALFPRNYWLVLAARTFGWVAVTMCGGTGPVSVALSDLVSGSELAQANATFFAVIGAGVMAGQLIGDNILIWFGQPRFVFAARAVLAGIHLAFNYLFFQETLPVAERRPFAGVVNPLRCFSVVLNMGAPLRKLMFIAMGQYCTEGKHLIGFRNLWLTTACGMGMRQWSNFGMAYSLAMIGGGQLAARCIQRFGRRGYTTLSNITNMVGYACWSQPRLVPMWLGLAILLPGINAVGTSASKAMCVDLATAQGMGKGEFASCE